MHLALTWLVPRATNAVNSAAASRRRNEVLGGAQGLGSAEDTGDSRAHVTRFPGGQCCRGRGDPWGEELSASPAGCLSPTISDVDTGLCPCVPTAAPLNAAALRSALLGPSPRTPRRVAASSVA